MNGIGARPVYLHIDVDVVDGDDLPGLRFPIGQGPSFARVLECPGRVVATVNVAAACIACAWLPERFGDEATLASDFAVGRGDRRAGELAVTADRAKDDAGVLVSVHVGQPRESTTRREAVSTAIWKYPVDGRVAVRGVNLDGDDQADRSVHGGPDKAVYAYAEEEVQAWERELGRDLGEAAFGQNLTTRGIEVSDAVIGERWLIGSTLLEVAQPRQPCFKLGIRIGEPGFVKRFAQASRPGAYLRIVTEGEYRRRRSHRDHQPPDHGVTCRMVSDALLRDPEPATRGRSRPRNCPSTCAAGCWTASPGDIGALTLQ